MRESIGGTWITGLVITFTFLFAAFLALSVNYSRAFRVKNQVLTLIEKKEGINTNSIKFINAYLRQSGYSTKGHCSGNETNMYGVKNISEGAHTYEKAKKSTKYYYCFAKMNSKTTNFEYKAYYEVELFFKFNLPIPEIGYLSTFVVDGQTKDVIYPSNEEGHCSDSNPKIKCN